MIIKQNVNLEVAGTWSQSGAMHVFSVSVDGEPLERMSVALCPTTQGWDLRAVEGEASTQDFDHGYLPIPVDEALHELRGNGELSSFIADQVEKRLHMLHLDLSVKEMAHA